MINKAALIEFELVYYAYGQSMQRGSYWIIGFYKFEERQLQETPFSESGSKLVYVIPGTNCLPLIWASLILGRSKPSILRKAAQARRWEGRAKRNTLYRRAPAQLQGVQGSELQ